jgi:hypothetical protein
VNADQQAGSSTGEPRKETAGVEEVADAFGAGEGPGMADVRDSEKAKKVEDKASGEGERPDNAQFPG